MSEPTLAEVILDALREHGSLLFEYEMERSDKIPADVHAHIAAAVTAWATGDATVERMALALARLRQWENSDQRAYFRSKARDAVAALLGARGEDTPT